MAYGHVTTKYICTSFVFLVEQSINHCTVFNHNISQVLILTQCPMMVRADKCMARKGQPSSLLGRTMLHATFSFPSRGFDLGMNMLQHHALDKVHL